MLSNSGLGFQLLDNDVIPVVLILGYDVIIEGGGDLTVFVYFVESKMATSVTPECNISQQCSASDLESSFTDDTFSEEEEVACESRVSI